MSRWTYLSGVITVDVPGRTQAECDFNIHSVLNHLPKVTGSEHDMEWHINASKKYKDHIRVDEFGNESNLGNHNVYFNYYYFEKQNSYFITISGELRDRCLDETIKEFSKWLCRLAKRLWIDDINVHIHYDWGNKILIDNSKPYFEMYDYSNNNWLNRYWQYMSKEYISCDE